MTRVEAQDEILEIAGPGIGIVGLSVTPDEDGVIASLNSALRAGFSAIGLSPAGRVVTDDDIARIPSADEDRFLNAARLSILDTILFRWTLPNERENTTSQDWGSLYNAMRSQADILRGTLGLNVPMLGVGLIGMGIISEDTGDEFA